MMNTKILFLNYLRIIVSLSVTLLSVTAEAQKLRGVVICKETQEPLVGVYLKNIENNKIFQSDHEGSFEVTFLKSEGKLEVSYTGYKTQMFYYTLETGSYMVIELERSMLELQEVTINTGYQKLSKERVTGSFDNINSDLLNRSVSSDILGRIENLTPGLLFNHGDAANTDAFLIRGRSTITANAKPLIVVDDFPYDGDINNLNPNDIAAVSILKDAAAASIWGARAGNGVIVITTKNGSTSIPKIEYTNSISYRNAPDLFNINSISPADKVGLEQFLFEQGRYSNFINPTTLAQRTTVLPESVELMIANPHNLDELLVEMGKHDVRNDLRRHFYRSSFDQRHNLNFSGKQKMMSYYFSVGFDKNITNLVGEDKRRISLQMLNTFNLSTRVKVETQVRFFNTLSRRGNNKGYTTAASAVNPLSPYARLADQSGNAIAVYSELRRSFLDTVGRGLLLDWTYKPLEEITGQQHQITGNDLVAGAALTYKVKEWLNLSLKYQYENEISNSQGIYSMLSYHTRNLINNFSQINYNTGSVVYPIPKGSILTTESRGTTVNQVRLQGHFDKQWNQKHEITGLLGYEIRKSVIAGALNQHYGYNEQTGKINYNVDMLTAFPRLTSSGRARISLVQNTSELIDNFLSFYVNSSYTYKKRYTFTGSFRKDEANLFGVRANQKGVPLWSTGVAWNLSNEKFYKNDWLPSLRIRTSYGVNGNISRLATAQPVVTLGSSGFSHSYPTATLGAPANENLSWEQVRQMNIGLDFGAKNNRVSGSVEYYLKNAVNLLAQTPVDPTYGTTSMYLNVASMRGQGLDVIITTNNINRKLQWKTSFIYSYSAGKVTDYLVPVSATGRLYLPISLANPQIGKPLYSVFGLSWQGLDPSTGNPVGMFNHERSVDYNLIYNQTTVDDLIYKGSAQPVSFGSVLNQFTIGGFDFSFNVSYKLGYYFRINSIDYGSAFSGNGGHSDFARRWMKPGDELLTFVPSLVYPANPNRDNFYRYSEVLVRKADHIRMQDISLGYKMNVGKASDKNKTLRIYSYMSNLGVLWKADKNAPDPYYNNVPLEQVSYSLGMQLTF